MKRRRIDPGVRLAAEQAGNQFVRRNPKGSRMVGTTSRKGIRWTRSSGTDPILHNHPNEPWDSLEGRRSGLGLTVDPLTEGRLGRLAEGTVSLPDRRITLGPWPTLKHSTGP